MDTSEQNIKMLEKAIEIQALFKPQEHSCLYDYTLRWDWDSRKYQYDGYIEYGGGGKKHQFSTHDGYLWHAIWLPQQDKLQEMVIDSYREHWGEAIYPGLMEEAVAFAHQYPYASMEQLWLAFVMKKKFNKQWLNNDWVEG